MNFEALLINVGTAVGVIIASIGVAWKVRGYIAASEAKQVEIFSQLSRSLDHLADSVTRLNSRLDGSVPRVVMQIWIERYRAKNPDANVPDLPA